MVKYLSNPDITKSISEFHTNIINAINFDADLLLKLNGKMGIGEALKTFLLNVDRTILIFTDEAVCLLYGYNKHSKKYYGII
jgi:hypothetical protein